MNQVTMPNLAKSAAQGALLLALAGAALVGTAVQSQAAADPDTMVPTARYNPGGCLPNGNGVCRTDNSTVTYYMDSVEEYALEEVDKAVVRQVLAEQFNPTHLTVTYDSNPTFSGSAETDIVYREGGVPAGAIGVTRCNDPASGYECDQQYVEIRGGGEYDYGTTCHETGHAVGLLHGSESTDEWGNAYSNTDTRLGCLTTPAANVGLGTIRIADINQQY